MALAAIVIACGDDGVVPESDAGAADAAVTELSVTDYCAQYAAKRCTSIAMCEPLQYASIWGDSAKCATALAAQCTALVSGDGVARKACLDATDLSTCAALAAWMAGSHPPECALMGPLVNGASCFGDSECASGTCEIANGLRCGTCAAPPAASAACLGSGCVAPTVCAFNDFAGTGSSQTIGEIGDSCDSLHICSDALACENGTCVAALALGAACKNTTECGFEHFCNATTHVCEAIQTKAIGEACGLVGNGAVAYCATGSCRDAVGLNTGTCVARIAEGQPCGGTLDIFDGPCESPAQCIHGTCTTPGASLCTAPLVPSVKATTCSVNGTATTITFHNTSATRDLAIYWVDQTCLEVFYEAIPAGASWTESTYAGHHWRVRDADTNELVKEVVGDVMQITVEIP